MQALKNQIFEINTKLDAQVKTNNTLKSENERLNTDLTIAKQKATQMEGHFNQQQQLNKVSIDRIFWYYFEP